MRLPGSTLREVVHRYRLRAEENISQGRWVTDVQARANTQQIMHHVSKSVFLGSRSNEAVI